MVEINFTMKRTNLLKNYFIICFLLFGGVHQTIAQSKDDVKLGVGLQGLELSVNKKIYQKFYFEAYAGLGGGYDAVDGFSYTLDFKNLVPFTKGIVKWNYVDLDRKRNFVSLQAKYSFGDSDHLDLNKILLTEINWGIERHFTKNFIFEAHAGLGHLKDFDVEKSLILPTLGFSLKYRIFSIDK